MPKNIFPQFCLLLLFGAIVSVAVLPAVSEINKDVQNYNNGYREVKNNEA